MFILSGWKSIASGPRRARRPETDRVNEESSQRGRGWRLADKPDRQGEFLILGPRADEKAQRADFLGPIDALAMSHMAEPRGGGWGSAAVSG